MIQMLDKKESREERKRSRQKKAGEDIEAVVLDFISKKHLMFVEWKEKGTTKGGIDDPVISRSVSKYSAGHPSRPFISGEVIEPIRPVKLRKGVKLVLKDKEIFKEPIVSPAMQRNLRILELRLDANGYLYSPKSFDPEWTWQSQAIWLRLNGLGELGISQRLKVKHNSIKSMFGRLKLTKFYPPCSPVKFASIGYRGTDTPSGWTAILYGGASGILYPESDVVIDQRTGKFITVYRAHFNIGESISLREGLLEIERYQIERTQAKIKPFSFKKHKKELKQREKEYQEGRKAIILEQKTIEIENLKKNIAEGFDPEIGMYKELDNDV